MSSSDAPAEVMIFVAACAVLSAAIMTIDREPFTALNRILTATWAAIYHYSGAEAGDRMLAQRTTRRDAPGATASVVAITVELANQYAGLASTLAEYLPPVMREELGAHVAAVLGDLPGALAEAIAAAGIRSADISTVGVDVLLGGCPHPDAELVEAGGETVAWLCPECLTQLPATWKSQA